MRQVLWAGLVIAAGMLGQEAVAQVVPDATLGAEGSRVRAERIRGRDSERIEGGAQRGGNLFHSFERFDVPEGRGAYFNSPATVQNIFGRVTGSSPSEINGTLGVIQEGSTETLGTANLFFMNPNGILFGSNSSLDVGGSFAATTANAIQFGEQGFFATNDGTAPGLLTVNPSAFLFNQVAAQNSPIITNRANTGSGLRVRNGQNLLLLGGNVISDGGRLSSLGGEIEIGSVAGTGTVGLNSDRSLNFSENLDRGNISFNNQSRVSSAVQNNGGSITVMGRNIDITGQSSLGVVILQGLSLAGSQAGDLTLDATGNIRVQQSRIENNIDLGASGNGGDLNITARSMLLENGSQLQASNGGQGNAGSVIINTTDSVSLNGRSGISSNIVRGGVGAGGRIDLTTRSLILTDGSQLQASTRGQGNAGHITINALDSVFLNGRNGAFPSSIFSNVERNGLGAAGSINLITRSLTLTNGAQIAASTRGQGNAGHITINALNSVSLDSNATIFSTVERDSVGNGGSINLMTRSLALTNGAQFQTNTRGQGNAGDVTINATDTVSLNGSVTAILSIVEQDSVGAAGNINLTTRSLSLTDNAALTASTRGQGNAGNVIINATDSVSLDGSSTIFSIVEQGGSGTGGSIDLTARSLSLTDGAQLQARTRGQGNAGNVIINANGSVSINGVNRLNGNSSAILTNAEAEATGRGNSVQITTPILHLSNGAVINARTANNQPGGDITINANTLEATSGGQLITSTLGAGQAGNITLNVRDDITFSGQDLTFNDRLSTFGREVTANEGNGESGLFANTRPNSTGNGGTITLNTNRLTLRDNAQIAAFTAGMGNSGNIIARDTSSIILNNSTISTRVNSGAALSNPTVSQGNIDLQTRQLALTNGAEITSSTSGQGDAGSITIRDANAVSLNNSSISTEVASQNAIGSGGDIRINTATLDLNQGRISSSAVGQGDTGSITVQANRGVELNNSSITSEVRQGATGNSQNITLATPELSLQQDAQISAATNGNGRAGSITIRGVVVNTPAERVILNNSDISTEIGQNGVVSAGDTQRSNIGIRTRFLSLNNDANITASTQGQGRAGNISVSGAEQVSLNRSNISTAVGETGVGQGGDISVRTGQLNLQNRSNITSSTANRGNTGSITVNATEGINLRRNSRISNRVETSATGNSQRITLNTPSLALRGDSAITAATDGNGRAGDVQLQADSVSLSNSRISTQVQRNAIVPVEEASRANSNQGNITIDARSLSLDNESAITASTNGRGRAGNVTINNADEINLNSDSRISSAVGRNGRGQGGNVRLETDNLRLNDSRINTSTNAPRRAGNITVTAANLEASNGGRLVSSTNRSRPAGTITLRELDNLSLSGRDSGIFANTNRAGQGGSITLDTTNLTLNDGATISSASRREVGQAGNAGSLDITATGSLSLNRSDITTTANRSAGGDIAIRGGDINLEQGNIRTDVETGRGDGGSIRVDAEDIELRDNSDIQTTVGADGRGNGGDITVNADSVIAFDDSDIITESPQGQGGDINLNTPVFFGAGYQEASDSTDNANDNGRVDLDASGAVSAGAVQTPDTSFIQNSLTDLPDNALDTEALLANSCIARTEDGGTFLVTGTGGLPPNRPGSAALSAYPTGEVRAEANWQPGDPIVEPQGVYRLPNGELVMMHECR